MDDPRRFGIPYVRADGTLERIVEKPDLHGRHMANTGAYVFPRDVFAAEPTMSERGEYEIIDYVNGLAARQPVRLVEARVWLPIGTKENWHKAQAEDLETVLDPGR